MTTWILIIVIYDGVPKWNMPIALTSQQISYSTQKACEEAKAIAVANAAPRSFCIEKK